MSKPKVLVTRQWPQAVEAVLAERFDATFNRDDLPMDAAAIGAALAAYDAVLPTVSDKLPAGLFDRDDIRTKILGNFGVGFNHIDTKAASARGIAVTNTPGVLTDCTADIAMTLLLSVARRAGEGERQVRAGRIRGAGLDVFEREPHVPEALREMENVVVLPHLGSATEETRTAIGMKVVDNITAFFEGREPPDRVA